MRTDEVYETVFNRAWDLRVFLACIEITRAVESSLNSKRSAWWNSLPIALSHFISFVYVCEQLGKIPYEPEEIIPILNCIPTTEDVFRIRDELLVVSKTAHINERRFKGILLNSSFVESYVLDKLSSRNHSSGSQSENSLIEQFSAKEASLKPENIELHTTAPQLKDEISIFQRIARVISRGRKK